MLRSPNVFSPFGLPPPPRSSFRTPGSKQKSNKSQSSSSSKATKNGQKSKFVLQTAIPDDDIVDSDVVIPKDKRGQEGSKHWNAIMDAVEVKFGVPRQDHNPG